MDMAQEHPSEWLVTLNAPTLEALFEGVGQEITSLMLGGAPLAPSQGEVWVALEGKDTEALLAEWVNELVFLAEARGMCHRDFRVQHVTPTKLNVSMQKFPVPVHFRNPIKAATYHRLKVAQGPSGYTATFLLDV